MAYVKTRTRSNGRVSYLVCWTDSTGRECQRTYPSKAPANRALKERIAQEARDELSDEAASRQRFALVARGWLEAVSLEVKPRTSDSYDALLRRHVLPEFGDRRIGVITSQSRATSFPASRSSCWPRTSLALTPCSASSFASSPLSGSGPARYQDCNCETSTLIGEL